MKAYVNKDICIACSMCKDTCEDVFSIENGVAVAINREVPLKLEFYVKLAYEYCPVQAIYLEETDM